MLWQVTVALTGPRPKVDQERRCLNWEEKYTERERECVFFALLDQAKGTGRPVPWQVEPVSPVSRPVQHFDPENLSFFGLFSSNTQARSLGKLICQF